MKKKKLINDDDNKTKRGIILGLKWYELLLIIVAILLLVFILIFKDKNNLRDHCLVAICNEDNTICFNYDENGTKSWEGDCSTLK